MAKPVSYELPTRDPQIEFTSRLQNAPQEHAEALLAAYELLQGFHDSGLLELMRGMLGGGEKIVEQAVEVARAPESIRTIRNMLLLARTLGDVDPALLRDFSSAVPKALAQANADEARPPGLLKLLSTFLNRDFRRGLAAFNDLLVMFGRNLREKTS